MNLRRANPVLLLTIALPAVAIIASFASLGVTLAHPDGELPEQYHWEGLQLDRDFSRGERAARLHVRVALTGLDRGGRCMLSLGMDGPAPRALRVTLAHATLAARDVKLMFERSAGPGTSLSWYAAPCTAIAPGHWRVEVADADGAWSIRTSRRSAIERLTIDTAADREEE